MRRRILAWANLGWRFLLHSLRLPLRAVRPSRSAGRFLGRVAPEGFLPLLPAERAAFPEFMACIHCGLCSLACPALREAPRSAWEETWTFVAGPSRAIDRPALLGEASPCARCGVCAAVCPTGVPIPRLAAMVGRLAEAAGETPQPTGEP